MGAGFGISVYDVHRARKLRARDLTLVKHPERLVQEIEQTAIFAVAKELKKSIEKQMKEGQITPALGPISTHYRTFRSSSLSPLYDSGQLANSLEVRVISRKTVAVSIPFDKMHFGIYGRVSMGALAKNLSQGYTITVTPQMRKFFFAMSRSGAFPPWVEKIRTGTTLVVPARPFFENGVQAAPAAALKAAALTNEVIGKYINASVRQVFMPLTGLLKKFIGLL